jgi:glycosyltransferase involved in cell wall biosynthesis
MMETHKLRVLHIVSALGMGGAETWLMELMKHWKETGRVQMDLLLTSGEAGIFDVEARRLGAQLFYVPYRRSSLPAFIRTFRQILREGCYDAIHDHSDYVSGWRLLMGLGVLPNVRVAHVHNPWLHIDANYAVNPIRRLSTFIGQRLLNLLATRICGTSTMILRQYGFEPIRSQKPLVNVVHCGIDVSQFSAPRNGDRASVVREFGWTDDVKIVLFVGRLDRAVEFDHPQNHKNSWFALNVARAAVQTEPRLRLLMAGAGEHMREELGRRITEWRLQGKLKLIGIRRDIPRLMRAADALLFPSRQEGLGMVAVEAQATGLPVLASTAVPSEAIVVPDLYRALSLQEPVTQWASALIDHLNMRRPALSDCRQALERSDFSIVNSARQLVEIYDAGAP